MLSRELIKGEVASMTEETIPALDATPAEGVAISDMRERIAVALVFNAEELDEAGKLALAAALCASSPVAAIVAAFDALSARMETLGPALLSRSIEAADLIASHSWHGRGGDAANYATAARNALPSGEV